MARVYLTSLDLNKNELLRAVVQVLASAPSSPVEGQIYYNSADKVAYIYNGTAWKKMEENVAIDFGESGDIVASAPGDTAAAGSTGEVADAGHRHARTDGYGSTASTQAIGDSAAAGSSGDVSRADHKHAMPAFGNVTASTSYGASSANGSATTVARSDHAHGTPAHGASEHSAIKISDLAAPSGSVSFGSQKITSLADPTDSGDAANKGYVDAAVAGLSWKDAVRVATTTAGTLASDYENGDTVDGVTLATGDRILIKDASSGSENGIYVVKASGAPDRATDADSATDLRGAAVFVEEGTANAGNQYILTTDNITLGTTSLTWTQFGSTTTYTWGNGLSESSGTVSVGAGTGISVAADTVAIDTSTVARYYLGTITGNASSTSFSFTHNLQQFVSVQVVDGDSPYDQVECDVERTSSTACAIKFNTAPANAKTYKVIIVG